MTDFATLTLAADTTGLKRAQQEFPRLVQEGDKAEKALERSTDKMGQHFRKVGGAVAKMAAGAFGVIASGRWLSNALRETEQLERNMLRMQSIISATGGSAGRTADQLHEQARALALGTLASTEGIMQAQTTLLTFRQVQGEVFDQAIVAALDMAEALGGDVNGAVLQLGKALEDPVTGMSALSRSGTVFTEAQKEMVKGMVEAGDKASAQKFILAELEAQYGGAAAAAAGGLAGAQDTLAQRVQETSIAFAESFGLMAASRGVINLMAEGMRFLGDNMDSVRVLVAGSAAVLVGMYTPAIVAATIATGTWIASLITLRGALMATGIGALVVGAGLLIDFLIRLVQSTGSWGEALSALGDLASGVWEGIKTSAKSIGPALQAVWETIRSGFFGMLGSLSTKWADFLHDMTRGMANIPGMERATLALSEAAIRAGSSVYEFNSAADIAEGNAARLKDEAANLATEGFDKAKAALDQLRKVMAGGTEETTANADAARDLTKTLGEVEGAAGGAKEKVKELTDAQKEAERAADQMESTFESAFVGFVTGAKSARKAIGELLQSLAQMAAKAAFQGLFGGSDIFSTLSSVFGGSVGKRAVGGPAEAGTPYLVNEGTPNSEIFVPSQSGGVLNVPQAQAALASSARSGGAVDININAKSDPGVILDISQRVSRETVRAGLDEFSGGPLTTLMRQNSLDPRAVRT